MVLFVQNAWICLKLFKTVQEKIQTTADNDIIYNESRTIENNITYMKHRLRDAQSELNKLCVR